MNLLQERKECWVCGSPYVVKHHVYGGARRQISEREKCWVWLCPFHHNMSDDAVHFNHELDQKLKIEMQLAWMTHNKATKEDFIRIFGKGYV